MTLTRATVRRHVLYSVLILGWATGGCDGGADVGTAGDGGGGVSPCADGYVWTGRACLPSDGDGDDRLRGGGSGNGIVGVDGGTTPPDLTGKKRIFFTSATFDGNLAEHHGGGALAAADTICNTAAEGALLGGSWKAWLSTTGVNAIDRIADVGPWYRLDGLVAFNNRANLAGTPIHGIRFDERGRDGQWDYDRSIWTGTTSGGRLGDSNCQDWTSNDGQVAGRYGLVGETEAPWTDEGFAFCDGKRHLICIEQ